MEKKPNLFVLLLCLALSCVYCGWILKMMWAWFIVPLGVAPLSLAHAIGLDSLLTTYRYHHSDHSKDCEWYVYVIKGSMVHLVLFLNGLVAHAFM